MHERNGGATTALSGTSGKRAVLRIRQQCATNKEALFKLLKEDVVKLDYPPSQHVYITSGSHIKSNRADISMSANDHEEADSRICLHVDDALNERATTVLVRTVGTANKLGWKSFCMPSRVLMQSSAVKAKFSLESIENNYPVATAGFTSASQDGFVYICSIQTD